MTEDETVANVFEQLPRGGRVAVLRLRSLGDCVLTTPALDLLKRWRPDLRVAVMVEARFRDVFENNPDVDDILPVKLSALRQWGPRLCLNLHGGTRSAWLTAASGAQFRAGFAHFRNQFCYNLHIGRAQEILNVQRPVHTAEHLASAMFWLGVPRAEIPRAKLIARNPLPRRPLAVIHAVAATPSKTWRADGFLAVAEHLRAADMEPVFIGAAAAEVAPFCRTFRTLAGAPLEEIKALLSSASLFVGNDSGPAHMAAAFGLPAVAIFGASDPAIWGPWRTAAEVVASPGGIGSVTIDQVLSATMRLRVHA
jgi:ADP-heptose:LPS heptosyltransferase